MTNSRFFRILLLSIGLLLTLERKASAQYPLRAGFGPGWGYGFGPRVGPWFGPGLWGWNPWFPYFYSGAYGSFWSNGLSLYGPPVPTYGPIPGSFGGSDAHKLYYGNGGFFPFWLPSNSGVYGAAREFNPVVPPSNWKGPRFGTRDVKRRYAEDRANPQSAIDRAYRDTLPFVPRR